MLNPLKRQFVSEIDDFLIQFDQSHPEKSQSQKKEIAKHARIAQLRDGASLVKPAEDKEIWEKF
ncbi:MAG: CBU_0585 family protein [Pseudomonadota bacterium]